MARALRWNTISVQVKSVLLEKSSWAQHDVENLSHHKLMNSFGVCPNKGPATVPVARVHLVSTSTHHLRRMNCRILIAPYLINVRAQVAKVVSILSAQNNQEHFAFQVIRIWCARQNASSAHRCYGRSDHARGDPIRTSLADKSIIKSCGQCCKLSRDPDSKGCKHIPNSSSSLSLSCTNSMDRLSLNHISNSC